MLRWSKLEHRGYLNTMKVSVRWNSSDTIIMSVDINYIIEWDWKDYYNALKIVDVILDVCSKVTLIVDLSHVFPFPPALAANVRAASTLKSHNKIRKTIIVGASTSTIRYYQALLRVFHKDIRRWIFCNNLNEAELLAIS